MTMHGMGRDRGKKKKKKCMGGAVVRLIALEMGF